MKDLQKLQIKNLLLSIYAKNQRGLVAIRTIQNMKYQ